MNVKWKHFLENDNKAKFLKQESVFQFGVLRLHIDAVGDSPSNSL